MLLMPFCHHVTRDHVAFFQRRRSDEDHDHREAAEGHACPANSDRHTPRVRCRSENSSCLTEGSGVVPHGVLLFSSCSQVHPKELNNGIINAAFLLLFKDLVKLFASYNDGIINLLGQ